MCGGPLNILSPSIIVGCFGNCNSQQIEGGDTNMPVAFSDYYK